MKSEKLFGNIKQLVSKNLPSLKNVALFEMVTAEKHGAPFSFNMLDMSGSGQVARQDHPEQHAIYVVEGDCRLRLGEEWVSLTDGSYAYIPPNLSHEFKVDAGKQAKILILKL